MSDASLRIKNLSISLEALSRIGGGEGAMFLYNAVEALLREAIDEAQKEQNPIRTVRSAELTTSDDDIPF
jgi:hypothetical protein